MIGIAHTVPWLLTDKILDKEGCFVLLRGKLNSCRLTIVGVYAPNSVQVPFWEKIFTELMHNTETEILLLGDFNSVISKHLDSLFNSDHSSKFSSL